MELFHKVKSLAGYICRPLQRHATFFIFMYVLGVLVEWLTLPPKSTLYSNLWLELLLDLYILCFLLTALPSYIGRWVKLFFYTVAYTCALADVYCFVNFDSSLTPSILMLVGETNSREASDFLSSLVTPDLIFSSVGYVLLLLVANILMSLHPKWRNRLDSHLLQRWLWWRGCWYKWSDRLKPWLQLSITVLLFVSILTSAHNKAATWKLMTGHNISEVEHTLTEQHHAVLFTPVYRLIFSLYANSLAAQQINQLIKSANKVHVDSCSVRSPEIVLIIGESYAKNHSQMYGYPLPTTPRQIALEKSGHLVKYTDVVSCWNLTSFVFKNVFSMYVVGGRGEWCDYPLFPEVFRKAGYHVTFLTNQFLPKAKEAVYDFSGGFFLNNPVLSKAQFDTRNTQLHQFDDGLLADYDQLNREGVFNKHPNLTIFHLIGQHVSYNQRYPLEQRHFTRDNYTELRPDLTPKQRGILAHYDNAVLYNDSIVDQIVKRYAHSDAIVIYMPDHGEECYEGNRGFICRNHSAAIDWPLAHYEFEIPFWIYCSPSYTAKHPDIVKEVREARQRPYMTDALPHLLLYLAGISAPYYNDRYNILSPQYDSSRPRILKNSANYDLLRTQHLQGK